MNNSTSFWSNKWTKLFFSLFSAGYGAFLAWLAWLSSSHYWVSDNIVVLFSLYLIINLVFGAIMLYTRKEILTRIMVFFFHPCILVMLIFSFGNYYLLIPAFIISTIVFILAKAPENVKIVIGTIYLILFVIGYLGYLTMQIFSMKIFDVNLKNRSADYLYSPQGSYRLVQYIDSPDKSNRTIIYYVEPTSGDLHFGILDCYDFKDGIKVLTAPYDRKPQAKWINDKSLLIDGEIREFSKHGADKPKEADEEQNGETSILITTSANND
jgi:hypothetical protein